MNAGIQDLMGSYRIQDMNQVDPCFPVSSKDEITAQSERYPYVFA